MAIGKLIERQGGHIAGFIENTSEMAEKSREAFVTFFDQSAGFEDSFVRGNWDFSFHIAGPSAPFLQRPVELRALEIGYGAGRVLAAAARHFGRVIGVDVHRNSELVRSILADRGINNAILHETDGMTFPVPSASVDFVYSFIVMQHMERISIFRQNLEEAARVLRPGGVAILYFGRLFKSSHNTSSRCRAFWDVIRECTPFTPLYLELPAHVNETNLVVSRRHAKCLFQDVGLTVLAQGLSRKHVPDGSNLYGGQSYCIAKRC